MVSCSGDGSGANNTTVKNAGGAVLLGCWEERKIEVRRRDTCKLSVATISMLESRKSRGTSSRNGKLQVSLNGKIIRT